MDRECGRMYRIFFHENGRLRVGVMEVILSAHLEIYHSRSLYHL